MALTTRGILRGAFSAALLGVSGYYALWGGEYSIFDLGRLADQQEAQSARLATTRAEVDSLQALITQLEDDPAAIEAVARDQFGMIRDGETLYRFVEIDDEPPDLSAK